MPTVVRHPGSPFWYAAWMGADGKGGKKLILRSTKLKDRTKAMALAIEYAEADSKAVAGMLFEAQARKVVNSILERAGTGDAIRSPSIEAHFKEWLQNQEAHKSAGTAARYGKVVREFLAHLGGRASKPLESLAPAEIETFIGKRLNAGLAPGTVNLDGKIIRAVLNRARRQGLITTNPAEAVDLPSAEGVERVIFTAPEVKMLMDAAEPEWRTLILVGYYTGQRLTDCTKMAWADVDLAAGTWSLRQGKTDAKLLVPLHPALLQHLEGLAGTDTAAEFVMPHMAELGPGGRHGLSEGFKRVARKAGVDTMPVKGGGKRMICRRSFHALRHSFTSALLNAGVSPELRMKLTGHKSAEVHRGYSHAELATLKSAVAKLPSVV